MQLSLPHSARIIRQELRHRLWHTETVKALVTGGAGFIGSHVAESLLAAGWEVIVLDDLSNGFESNIPRGARFVRGDARGTETLDSLLPGCAAVLHLAAVSSVQDSLDRPLEVHEINLTMTLQLLEAARRHSVPRFVFSSSAAIYGDTGGKSASEDTPPNPLSHYAVQKLSSEHYCRAYRRLFGLETVCLRYFNIFGPRQRPDSPYSGVIARFLDAARSGRAITIYGDGAQTRDFCPVSNVAAANLSAATAPADEVAGKSFNIGSGSSTTVAELAESVRHCFPDSPDPVFQPMPSGEIRHSKADISLAVKHMRYISPGRLSAHLSSLCKAPMPTQTARGTTVSQV